MIPPLPFRLCAALFAVLAATAPAAGQQSQGQAQGRAVLMSANEWRPYLWFENGNPRGLAVEKAEAAFARIGRRLVLVETPFPRGLLAAERGERAGVLLLGRVAERPYLAYSQTLFCDPRHLYFRRGSAVNWQTEEAALYNARVGKLRGPTYGPVLRRWEETGFITPVEMDNGRMLFRLLLIGRIDAAVFSAPEAAELFKAEPDFRDAFTPGQPPLQTLELVVGFTRSHPDSALLPAFDRAVTELNLGVRCG